MTKESWANILVRVIGFSALVASVSGYCPNSRICNCTQESIKCTCLQRDDVTFIEDNDDSFTGTELIIEGCGKVELMKLSLKDLNAELVDISDLQELVIETYAFDGSNIRNFHINNISGFYLETYGLGNIKNISNLIINNVTLENILPAVLGDSGVQNMAITNSHIGTIMSRALHIQNIESFLMENNIINAFDLTSIVIKGIKRFRFLRNSVLSTSFGSISLMTAEMVDFGHCSFRHIHSSMIVTKDLDVFSFHDCHIEYCEERAFWSIQANRDIRFVNNQILMTGEDSLLPNLGPNMHDISIISNENNSFVCDCELEWLLNEGNQVYDFIKARSICHEPSNLAGLKLSQLTVSMENVGTCISVQALTTTVTIPRETTTVTSDVERKSSWEQSKESSTSEHTYAITDSSSSQVMAITSRSVEERGKYSSQRSSGVVKSLSLALQTLLFFIILW